MRNLVLSLALAAPIVQVGFAPSVSAQSTVEVQANPVGPGPVSASPPNPANADSPVPAALPADPAYHGGAYTGALTPPPASAMNKTYPLCNSRLHDNCVNNDQVGTSAGSRRRTAANSQRN